MLDAVEILRGDMSANGFARDPDGDLIAGIARIRGRAKPASEVVLRYAGPELFEKLVPNRHLKYAGCLCCSACPDHSSRACTARKCTNVSNLPCGSINEGPLALVGLRPPPAELTPYGRNERQ